MTDDEPIDDDELELEPVDPEVIKHQQERSKRQTRAAEDAVDINAVYEEEDLGDPIDLDQLKSFRFTTRHLLIATALLALVMTLIVRLESSCMGLFVSGCIALGAGWWFVTREERRRLEKIQAQREHHAHKLAKRRAVEDGEPLPQQEAHDPQKFEQLSADWEYENDTQSEFKFAFSMKEMLVTFTVAALILGCAQVLGFSNAALLIGFVALLGLIVQAFGVDLPPLVVLGWWMLLVLYIVISVWTTFAGPTAA